MLREGDEAVKVSTSFDRVGSVCSLINTVALAR